MTEDKTAYEFLLEHTNPEYVNFEFDSYWVAEAGIDPLMLMQKLGDRLKLYHINDRGTRLKGPSMTPILTSDSMELGYGNMNLTAMVDQVISVGTDAVILETHKNWVDGSPVKSLEISAEFMNKNV